MTRPSLARGGPTRRVSTPGAAAPRVSGGQRSLRNGSLPTGSSPQRRDLTRSRHRRALWAGLCCAVLAGCAPQSSPSSELRFAVIETYADIVLAGYADSLAAAESMREAIIAFIAAPSEESLETAKQAWLAAREPYGQTEAFRFYGGPIDDENGPEAWINAWPLDEAYIDYVVGDASAGLINATDTELSSELLVARNEEGAEENVSIGFHAIEFLLWGQDLDDNGPGARPFSDFVDGTGVNAARRAQYLGIVTDLLVEHLGDLAAAWSVESSGSYREQFLSQEPDLALRSMLTGIGVLSKSELAGERMFTALDNQSQEDEHSCFSDNTHRDIVANAVGIGNVLRGRYQRLDGTAIEGPGLLQLLAGQHDDLARDLEGLHQASLDAIREIPVPFDRAIIEPEQRELVLEAVYRLQEQGDRIAEAATALGLVINTALPE